MFVPLTANALLTSQHTPTPPISSSQSLFHITQYNVRLSKQLNREQTILTGKQDSSKLTTEFVACYTKRKYLLSWETCAEVVSWLWWCEYWSQPSSWDRLVERKRNDNAQEHPAMMIIISLWRKDLWLWRLLCQPFCSWED